MQPINFKEPNSYTEKKNTAHFAPYTTKGKSLHKIIDHRAFETSFISTDSRPLVEQTQKTIKRVQIESKRNSSTHGTESHQRVETPSDLRKNI